MKKETAKDDEAPASRNHVSKHKRGAKNRRDRNQKNGPGGGEKRFGLQGTPMAGGGNKNKEMEKN